MTFHGIYVAVHILGRAFFTQAWLFSAPTASLHCFVSFLCSSTLTVSLGELTRLVLDSVALFLLYTYQLSLSALHFCLGQLHIKLLLLRKSSVSDAND